MASEAVDQARERVAALVGATAREIVFTSGSTESINLSIKGVLEAYATKGNHVVTCATEHKAVLDVAAHAERLGSRVTTLPVDEHGAIDLDALETAITRETVLVALMYANNEIGRIHPVRAISEICRRRGVLFFCDATQAVGRIPVDVLADGIDLLALSAHKFYGPKGCGALYVRRRDPRVALAPLIDGGGHERGFRSGTLNVPGIVGLGMAADVARQRLGSDRSILAELRDRLETGLLAIPETVVNAGTGQRLPHLTNVGFAGIKAEALIGRVHRHVAVSTASACSSASLEPSHVLLALGMAREAADASVRFSLGRANTAGEVDAVIGFVAEAVDALRAQVAG